MPFELKHGRFIPDGRPLAACLIRWRAVFAEQAKRAARAGRVWEPTAADVARFAAAAFPFLRAEYVQGATTILRELRGKGRRPPAGPQLPAPPAVPFAAPFAGFYRLALPRSGKSVAFVRKENPFAWASLASAKPVFGLTFDVFNPQVTVAVRTMAMNFARSTVATLADRVADAYEAALKARGDAVALAAASRADAGYAALRERLEAGLKAGASLRTLTEAVGEVFENPDRAFAIAATTSSSAMHMGQIAAAEAHSFLSKTALVSTDACDLCLRLDGMTVPIGEPFAINASKNPAYATVMSPPFHVNCLLPGTRIVTAGNIVSTQRAVYDGPVIRVKTSGGDDFAVTPNHLLLSGTGFLPASALVQGDEVIYYRRADGAVVPDDDGKPSPIEDVVAAFSVDGRVRARKVPVAPEHLHGDAAFCRGHIYTVHAEPPLRDDGNSLGTEGVDEGLPARVDGALRLFFVRALAATGGDVGIRRDAKAASRASRSGLRVPGRADGLLAGAMADSVSVHQITDVRIEHYKGFVYDVETAETMYLIGNGLVSGNCMCSQTIGDEDENPAAWAKGPLDLGK